MLQYKYSLMFSFGLCCSADTSLSLIAPHPGWPATSHPLLKLSPTCSHVLSPCNHLAITPPHTPHHGFTPISPWLYCAHGHGITDYPWLYLFFSLNFLPPFLPMPPLSVRPACVWCLSEPVKTALILITATALLACSVALLRQSLHNHVIPAVLSTRCTVATDISTYSGLISVEYINF